MMKSKLIKRAADETHYDTLKWLAFAFFAIIYFGLKDKSSWYAIFFLIDFVLILFIINMKREKSLEKIKRLFN